MIIISAGRFLVGNGGGMRVRLCGWKKKLRSRSACFNPRHGGRRSLPGRRTKPAFVWGQSVRLCLVADSQPHARTTLTVRGLCAREHATHSPDTGHIEVQARTTHAHTHTRSHTRTDTHICHMHSRTQSR